MAKMQRYSWPGNIRQLENLVKRYVVMGTEDVILSELLQPNERDTCQQSDAGRAGFAEEADPADCP